MLALLLCLLLVALGSLGVGRRVGREEGRDQLLAEQKAADDARRARIARGIPINLGQLGIDDQGEPLPVPEPGPGTPPPGGGAPVTHGPGIGPPIKGGF
jgi:hypothetical protein